MEVGESNYALLSSPYDSFMRKHLQHYGYFTGRSEIVKKYGFIPSKSHLISSSSDSDSSSDEDEHRTTSARRSPRENPSVLSLRDRDLLSSYTYLETKAKNYLTDIRTPLRPSRPSVGLTSRLTQNEDVSFEPRWPIEIEVLPEGRVKHLNVVPKQPESFYKATTTNHMPFVRSFDDNNGRVVFNYSPETCGYFIRSRIGGNREGCRQAAVAVHSPDDTTVIFESRFESGNLMKAVQVGEFEYELYLRYDLYTKRNTQWFYFRLQNIRANKRYRFSIVNFFKPTSLYNMGMKPLLYSVHDAETKGLGWRRWGEEIIYYRNNLPCPDNPSSNLYSLTWTCKFPNDNDTYYFAHCYPYTYSDLQDYLTEIQNDRVKSQYCKQKVLCRTLASNYIYLLTITNPSTNTTEHRVKKGVVLTARVHPGETNGSWMMKGLLDFLLGDSEDARLLRDNFIFKVVPMLNPDGVIVGNYRCSLSGRDLNRNYKTILKDAYPSIWHTREMIKRFMNETELVLYCDFHGHSRKQNVFLYGCENKHDRNKRLKERIFPAMLAKNDPSKFSYSSCKFKVQKHKEGTGRVVMWSLGILNSFTLEATFCGSSMNERAGHHFNTSDYESIGYHFLDSLLDYCDPDRTKRDRILHELEDDLRQAIQMKLLARGVNPASLSDIDLDQYSSEDDSSDDGGSDSSIDDGLPKHLEVIAAAKVRLKKTRKKKAPTKGTKETNKKEENDKENNEKSKPIGLPLSKSRNPHLPAIALLETSVLTAEENGLVQEVSEPVKATPPTSTRRNLDTSIDSSRADNAAEPASRSSRWPILTRPNNAMHRSTPAEEKARRSQAEYIKILTREAMLERREKHQSPQQLSDDDIHPLTPSYLVSSQQSMREPSIEQDHNNVIHGAGLAKEPRDAFTATYLLRRLNTIEQRTSATKTSTIPTPIYPLLLTKSRIEEDLAVQSLTDNEGELDISRTTADSNPDSRQLDPNYITNRLAMQLNERLLGRSRCVTRPKSSNMTPLHNRTLLDIRSIQPPVQNSNSKRIIEQHQHQRQRVMMVFGKQDSMEGTERSSNGASRSILLPITEAKLDDIASNHDHRITSGSKVIPIQPDNMAINLIPRYEASVPNPILSLNRIQNIKTSNVKKNSK